MKLEYSAQEIEGLFSISINNDSVCWPSFELFSSTFDASMNTGSGSQYVTLNDDGSLTVDGRSIAYDTTFKFFLKASTIGDISAYVEFNMAFTLGEEPVNNEPYFFSVLEWEIEVNVDYDQQ